MPPIMLFLIASLLCSPAVFAGERDSMVARGTPVVSTDTDVVKSPTTGPTTGPQSKVPESALFDRLVGTWDVSYEIYDKDGNVRRYSGQASYTWILDGGALQEVWTSDAHNKEPQPYGTTIGFYDGKRQCWTSVWIYPAQGMTTIVTGNEADGRIVLTGSDQAG